MQKLSQFSTSASRDDVADVSLRNWKSLYESVEALLKELPARKRRPAVGSLRKAHEVLQLLAPAMRMDESFFPEITIETKERSVNLNVVDFLAAGSLLSIAEWLDSWIAGKGPPPLQSIIAQAAIELDAISKSTTGKADWSWIKTRIKNQFGKALGTKTLYRMTRNWKEKTGRLRQRRQKEAFKLFAEQPVRYAKEEEVNAFFTLIRIKNELREAPEKTNRQDSPHLKIVSGKIKQPPGKWLNQLSAHKRQRN